MGSLSGSLYMMGLSSLFLRTILFSCVALGCFSPIVVVGKERSAVEVQAGNGTATDDDDTSKGGTDESDEGSTADVYNETVLVLDSNETVNFVETDISN